MKRIKVFVVDDHKLLREALVELLKAQKDIQVVGDASNGDDTLYRLGQLRPDIVLMDIDFGASKETEGITITRQITQQFDEYVRVIMLTMHNEPELVVKAFEAGARGYLPKESDSQHMLETIRQVHQGHVLLSPSQATKVMERFQSVRREKQELELAHLTDREKEILALVAQGKTNQQVAELLSISVQTVRNRLTVVFSKLHVNNRTQAAQYAAKLGLKANDDSL